MARSNVELAEKAAAAINGRDLHAWLSSYSDRRLHRGPERGRGRVQRHDGLRRFYADTVDEGDIETEVPMAGVADFEAGKCTRWEDFRERRLALQALGLES